MSQFVNSNLLNENKLLRKDFEVRQVFTIFTTIALNLLPAFASDYPEEDRSAYYALFKKWTYY